MGICRTNNRRSFTLFLEIKSDINQVQKFFIRFLGSMFEILCMKCFGQCLNNKDMLFKY